MFAPGKTAPRLVARIHRDLQTVVQDSAVTERMLSLGFEPVASSPADFAAVIRSELPKWQKVIAASGAKAD